jgi:hypothetical protein
MHGADYEQEWSVEEEVGGGVDWQANGRADTEWVWRRLRADYVFIDEARAKDCLRELLKERLVGMGQEMAATQALLGELSAGL